jgi:chaperone modulatory protein CbpM
MDEKDEASGAVEVIDAQTEFTLAELCRSCDVQAEFVEALVEEGILEPSSKRRRHWCFPASSLRRTRVTLHLQHDLGINFAGAALALDLLERIEELEARLRAVSAGRMR